MSLLPLYPLSRPAASLCALFRQHPAGLETVFFQQFVPVPARDTGHACGGPGIVAAQRPYPGHIVPLRLMPPAAPNITILLLIFYLIFNVTIVITAKIIPINQKRTTIFDSGTTLNGFWINACIPAFPGFWK